MHHTIGTFATRAQAGEAVTMAHFARALREAMASSDGEPRAVAAFRTAGADIGRAPAHLEERRGQRRG